jgi:molybdate transport system substrate-binding protein
MCLLLFVLWSPLALAETIKVAVAANFSAAMKELVAEFEKTSGHIVTLSFASTGKFYAQIVNGAPYHAFFSADQATAEKLEQQKKALSDSRFTYAIGALALWSSQPDFIDDQLQALRSGQFNKLALANPQFAPYGVAAVEVLEKLELKNSTRAKWVLGENIAQTFQFAATGNADLAFVALAQIAERGVIKKGSYWLVPGTFHRPIRQDAQILLPGKDSLATRQLMMFIRSAEAKSIIQHHGYQTPGEQ